MKRTELVRALESRGCILVRHGGKRHREIEEFLAKQIMKKLLSSVQQRDVE